MDARVGSVQPKLPRLIAFLRDASQKDGRGDLSLGRLWRGAIPVRLRRRALRLSCSDSRADLPPRLGFPGCRDSGMAEMLNLQGRTRS
jgi:hypothetical protein